MASDWVRQSSHWGAFEARTTPEGCLQVRPRMDDPSPPEMIENLIDAVDHPARVRGPAVRRGWLENAPGPSADRGSDEFVEVSASEVVELLAAEIGRVYRDHGPEGVYGGSYGWASAGRFHHAQSQVHRFLNLAGGYVRSVNTYSLAAAEVTIPHVLGRGLSIGQLGSEWSTIAEQTDLIVSFGGMPLKNAAITPGGVSAHTVASSLDRFRERGGELVLLAPQRHDHAQTVGARWIPTVPGTDVAVMLAMTHTLLAEDLVDAALVERLCVGWSEFADYVATGRDGRPFDSEWAATISGVPADDIEGLARRMVREPAIVNVSWSLQRAPFGEQPVWAGIALAVATGGIGVPGRGFSHGLGSMAEVGAERLGLAVPRFPQGQNPIDVAIPVARVSDLLLHPGETLDYDGRRIELPDIKLVWWAGGNPFHHHQDLSRLRRAFARPDTVVVNEPFWTGTARHADIVLPSTLAVERDDIGASRIDPIITAMRRVRRPVDGARNDYDWFTDLARALGFESAFTEGRSADDWLRHMYEGWRGDPTIAAMTPGFDDFWSAGEIRMTGRGDTANAVERFRADPQGHPLPTPSGRIEIVSATVRSFGYSDAPGHPAWFPPEPVSVEAPLCLLADQPERRLHSQLDMGGHSQRGKRGGREPLYLHPDDAVGRGIADGDAVLIRNRVGECLATAVITSDLMPGVVRLATGAWYTPEDLASGRERCLHGNPNTLTRDSGTSRLAQGCSGSRTRVEVERIEAPVEAPDAYRSPPFAGLRAES